MDDLIIIILTLIFVGVGILGQFKKKQAENTSETEQEPDHADDFWELLGSDEEVREQPQAQPTKEEEKSSKSVYRREFFEPASDSVTETEHSSIYAHDLTGSQNENEAKRSNKKDRFSLRKAVIYSEILNRKYT
jgi:hypothetical protein